MTGKEPEPSLCFLGYRTPVERGVAVSRRYVFDLTGASASDVDIGLLRELNWMLSYNYCSTQCMTFIFPVNGFLMAVWAIVSTFVPANVKGGIKLLRKRGYRAKISKWFHDGR